MRAKNLHSVILATVAASLMTACDVYVRHPAGEVEVTGAPPEPPAEVEVRTPAPGPEYVWIGGEWRWGPDHRWEWQRGRWDRRPHAGAVWRASHYEYRNGHHVYVEGGWR